jgi:hypothetical protein
MREFCTSGSVGTSGRKRPGVTRLLFVTIVTTVTSNDLIEGSRTPQHPPATPANNITFLELKWGPAGGDTGDDARTVTP